MKSYYSRQSDPSSASFRTTIDALPLAKRHGTAVSILRAHQYIGGDMKRLMVGVVAVLLFTGNAGAQTRRNAVGRPDAVTPAAGDALAGLTSAQRSDFFDGLADFRSIETVSDGLGPVFNERSCAACHSVPATGGGSRRAWYRFSRRPNGVY